VLYGFFCRSYLDDAVKGFWTSRCRSQKNKNAEILVLVMTQFFLIARCFFLLAVIEEFQGGEGGEAFLATQIKWLNSVAKKKYELPNAACFWQQGSIINNIPTGPSDPDCLFEVLRLLLLSTLTILETQAQGFRYTSSLFNVENS
jgi:hypothetical protein